MLPGLQLGTDDCKSASYGDGVTCHRAMLAGLFKTRASRYVCRAAAAAAVKVAPQKTIMTGNGFAYD